MIPKSWRHRRSPSSKPHRVERRGFRPTLEVLEDRLAPATFTVTNLNDSGSGSLRDAVLAANNTPEANLINFQSGLAGTITLTSGALAFGGNDLSIQGPGDNLLTVSGNHASQVFILEPGGTHNFTFSGLTIANGSSDYGSGIAFRFTSGTLTIQNCVFSGNSASELGGGLYVQGNGAFATTVNISGTTFTNNQAGDGGGGIAFVFTSGMLTIQNCVFSGNSASKLGGGLAVASVTTVNISGTTFTNNQAGDVGAASFSNSTATLTNCTISGNTASYAYGALGVDADGSGQTAALSLTNCTIAGNSGPFSAGLVVGTQNSATSASASYVNTIFANGASGSPNINAYAFGGAPSFTSLGYNLGDDGSGNLNQTGDQPNTKPLLGPLGNYSGPTPTEPLLPGSPAIDAGTNSGAPAQDQRGVNRVGAVDIGAFQSRGFTLSITGSNKQQALVDTAFATALSVQVSSAFGEPVQGGVVTFNAPGSGASVTFPTGTRATLNATGQGSLSVEANGTAGSYSVSAAASGATAANFSLTNLAAITLTPTTLAAGTYGSLFNQNLTATGGAGSPYTFTLVSGSLPNGLTLATNGALTGTPIVVGMFRFTVQATDNANFTGSQDYTLTIGTAPLTITAKNESKTYGINFTPDGTSQFTTSGLVNGDTISSVTLTSSGYAAAASVAGSPYPIEASAAVGSGLGNYTISYINGTLIVNPALLTVAADATRWYGRYDSSAAVTPTYTGLVNGDTGSSIGGPPLFQDNATYLSPPGQYSLTPYGLTTSNYQITYGAGTLTVTPAEMNTYLNPAIQAVAGKSQTYTELTKVDNVDPAGTADSYTATIDWGDHTTSAGTVVAENPAYYYDVSGAHAYSSPGSYTVTVTVQHKLHYTTPATAAGSAQVKPALTLGGPQRQAEQAFVQALYRDLLGREAEAQGLESWTAHLQAGSTHFQVVQGIWNSPEHRSLEVDQLYATYLHRAADAEGRAAWTVALLGGMSEEQVAAGFLTSAEYQQAHASPTAYPSGLYADVLGRQPDAPGLAAWQQAAQGGLSRQALAEGFLQSPEKQLQLVDRYYADFLGRAGEPSGVAAWMTALQGRQLSPDQVAQAFLASDEFYNRTAP
jgi:hypothetical protein